MDKRLCECHGEPMRWHKEARRRVGGYWRCAVRLQEHARRYRETHPVEITIYNTLRYTAKQEARVREQLAVVEKEERRIRQELEAFVGSGAK